MSNDPEQIRREIARTRGDLSHNVNVLGEKVNPASMARRQTDRVRDAAGSVKDSIFGSAEQAADAGHRTIESVGDSAAGAPTAVRRRTQGSPVAAGLIAFGAGLLLSSLLPATRVEQEAAEAVKDTAEPVLHELADAAKQTAESLKEPAAAAVDEVKTTATEAGQAIREDSSSAVDEVKAQAADSRERVRSSTE